MFFYSEIREIFLTPSVEDIFPISGYMTFPDGVRSRNVTLTSYPDNEEEANPRRRR